MRRLQPTTSAARTGVSLRSTPSSPTIRYPRPTIRPTTGSVERIKARTPKQQWPGLNRVPSGGGRATWAHRPLYRHVIGCINDGTEGRRARSAGQRRGRDKVGRRFANILETVGNTPVVRIGALAPPGANLFAKIEAFNPLGSVKDRLALGVIEAGEESGELKPGQTIIENFAGEPLDYWVTGFGTGGTLKGVGRVLRKERPETKIVVCEPEIAPMLTSGAGQERNPGRRLRPAPRVRPRKGQARLGRGLDHARKGAGGLRLRGGDVTYFFSTRRD